MYMNVVPIMAHSKHSVNHRYDLPPPPYTGKEVVKMTRTEFSGDAKLFHAS